MKLLLDEMMPRTIAARLRASGRDVIAVTERPDLRGLSDGDLFEQAQTDGRAVVTYNRDDFLAIDRAFRSEGRSHAGVVIVNPGRFPEGSTGPLAKSLDHLLDSGAPYPSFVHWLR